MASDIESLPACDWVIDAAANPNVLAGVDGLSSSRQLVEHNLGGTINLLEYCKRNRAGFTLLSTSRVYSIGPLAELSLQGGGPSVPLRRGAFGGHHRRGDPRLPHQSARFPLRRDQAGQRVAGSGIRRDLRLSRLHQPLRRTGRSRTVWPRRPGHLRLLDQQPPPSQTAPVYRIWRQRTPGAGTASHPADFVSSCSRRIRAGKIDAARPRRQRERGQCIGDFASQLTDWCDERFGRHRVAAEAKGRPFDMPWLVLDSRQARRLWGWRPRTKVPSILDEIAAHAGPTPSGLDLLRPVGMSLSLSRSSSRPATKPSRCPPRCRTSSANFPREGAPRDRGRGRRWEPVRDLGASCSSSRARYPRSCRSRTRAQWIRPRGIVQARPDQGRRRRHHDGGRLGLPRTPSYWRLLARGRSASSAAASSGRRRHRLPPASSCW